MFKALLTISLVLLVSCGKTQDSGQYIKSGGQDSGGGDHLQAGVKKVLAIFDSKENLAESLEIIIHNLKLFEPDEDQRVHEELNEHSEFLSRWFNTYNNAKIPVKDLFKDVVYKDICLNEKNEITSASTTKDRTTGNTQLCINTKKLAAIPQESLKRQIYGLLMHEYTHMIGLSHEDAVVLQNIVNDYYELVIGKKNASSSMMNVFKRTIYHVQSVLKSIYDLPKEKLMDAELKENNLLRNAVCTLEAHVNPVIQETINWMEAEIRDNHEKYENIEEAKSKIAQTNKLRADIGKIIHICVLLTSLNQQNVSDSIFKNSFVDKNGPEGNRHLLKDAVLKLAEDIKQHSDIDLSKVQITKQGSKPDSLETPSR